MAVTIIKSTIELGSQFILTPERYNPKRKMDIIDDDGILMSDIVLLSEDIITIKKLNDTLCYQINTGDAMGGCLRIPEQLDKLNSNKKILQKGDVIISRLRPYLKQIAYVDEERPDGPLCASTEFYVLRSRNNESIAFLVPFLMSDIAQNVFANSVEGSQHPRFKGEDILNLVIPRNIFEARAEISNRIIDAILSYRKYEKGIIFEMQKINLAFKEL